MNYNQAVRYLLTLGRELASPQQARAAKFDLQNISALAAYLGHPERAYPTVHVAGTNGKGSTAAMLTSILGAAGLRAGLYTSPHLLRINERLRIGDEEIADADFAAVFTEVQSAIEYLLARGSREVSREGSPARCSQDVSQEVSREVSLAAHPTYFECLTAMAFAWFAQRRVDLAVFEVGMGGRLDSTNIIAPEVAIITQIDFDHENFLGHSIEQIAAEKAGIIKPGAWVVSAAEKDPAARSVIRRRAAEQAARLVELDAAWEARDLSFVNDSVAGSAEISAGGCFRFSAAARPAAAESAAEAGHRATAAGESAGANARPIEISLPLAGRFQVRNALTAVAAARLLAERGFALDDRAIARGLAEVHWPGRLERLSEQPLVYLDGTHNPAGARELVAFWDEQFAGRRIHLIYGAMRDKAVDEVAGLLFPRAGSVIVTQSRQPRSISAAALAAMTAHLAEHLQVIAEPSAALECALSQAAPDNVVFATGSLYLVGDLRQYWNRREEPAESGAGAAESTVQAAKPAARG